MLLVTTLTLASPDGIDTAGDSAVDPGAAGLHWVAQRRYDEAVPCFEVEAERRPGQAAWAKLGSALHDRSERLFHSGDTRGDMAHVLPSFHAFDRTMALGPTPPQAAPLQSSNLAILGRYEEAREQVVEALARAMDPKLRMVLLDRIGELAQAPYPKRPDAIAFDAAHHRGSEEIRSYLDWVQPGLRQPWAA